MTRIADNRKGVSLVEVMAAVAICLIVIMGGFCLFVYGRAQIDKQGRNRVALQLAAQTLEELKAGSYTDIAEAETAELISLEGAKYNRSVAVEDVGPYKRVEARVNWRKMHQKHELSLTTLIAPQ
jgi:prepilin-type N-terminal cleavage/methylation domain-containing protein